MVGCSSSRTSLDLTSFFCSSPWARWPPPSSTIKWDTPWDMATYSTLATCLITWELAMTTLLLLTRRRTRIPRGLPRGQVERGSEGLPPGPGIGLLPGKVGLPSGDSVVNSDKHMDSHMGLLQVELVASKGVGPGPSLTFRSWCRKGLQWGSKSHLVLHQQHHPHHLVQHHPHPWLCTDPPVPAHFKCSV